MNTRKNFPLHAIAVRSDGANMAGGFFLPVNYYNEHDPKAAAWLRELIARGHIAPGVVDERSIEDITPSELAQYVQCHFFAGIGGWSLALRLSGWPDDKPVWTGSCPCQPFSTAGKGAGIADERHLWPAFKWLIQQCQPPVVFGEQVASKDGRGWLAGVRADLEDMAFTVGAADLCAAGVGAPHIRQRLFWVAYNGSGRREMAMLNGGGGSAAHAERQASIAGSSGMLDDSRMADAGHGGGWHGAESGEQAHDAATRRSEGMERMDNAECEGLERFCESRCADSSDGNGEWIIESPATSCEACSRMVYSNGNGCSAGSEAVSPAGYRSAADSTGFWSDSRVILCRDGKSRRIPSEPALFPLADGLSYKLARRGSCFPPLIRGPGNAIVPELAAQFIQACEEAITA